LKETQVKEGRQMGYTTEFFGHINVEPPLSQDEIAYLKKFNATRRIDCKQGPYYVDRGGFHGQEDGPDVIDYNSPPEGQPGLWCHWVPTADGTGIEWDEGEKFCDAAEWMKYLIDHFCGEAPLAKSQLPFLNSHCLNGEIEAQGEDCDDRWKLIVKDNEVMVADGEVVYQAPRAI
jgi:hypothetical protein